MNETQQQEFDNRRAVLQRQRNTMKPFEYMYRWLLLFRQEGLFEQQAQEEKPHVS